MTNKPYIGREGLQDSGEKFTEVRSPDIWSLQKEENKQYWTWELARCLFNASSMREQEDET